MYDSYGPVTAIRHSDTLSPMYQQSYNSTSYPQYQQYDFTQPSSSYPSYPHAYGVHQQGEHHDLSHGNPPPELSAAVTQPIASQAMKKLISNVLKDSGFSKAQRGTMERLEAEVVAHVERLYRRAHEYANLANRSGPILTDLMFACDETKLFPKDLRKVVVKHSQKRKRARSKARDPHRLVPAHSRSASPELLASDDEDALPVIPTTLQTLPPSFPSLPPKHTYLRTPASPPKKAAFPSLEKKLKTAGLVQESLKNLLLATDDSSGQEDGELLGHIVNWETGLHPRKRWKLSGY